MKKERITSEEICAAIREQGNARVEGIAAVVLETDGSLSVVKDGGSGDELSALKGVNRNDQ